MMKAMEPVSLAILLSNLKEPSVLKMKVLPPKIHSVANFKTECALNVLKVFTLEMVVFALR